jgi:hypothetical protein
MSEEVVICQSVLPVLKFYEQCAKDLFQLRLVSDKLLNAMFFVTEYYVNVKNKSGLLYFDDIFVNISEVSFWQCSSNI